MTQGTFLQEFAQPSAASAQATARRCMQLHAIQGDEYCNTYTCVHVYRYVRTYVRVLASTRLRWQTQIKQAVKGGSTGQPAIV